MRWLAWPACLVPSAAEPLDFSLIVCIIVPPMMLARGMLVGIFLVHGTSALSTPSPPTDIASRDDNSFNLQVNDKLIYIIPSRPLPVRASAAWLLYYACEPCSVLRLANFRDIVQRNPLSTHSASRNHSSDESVKPAAHCLTLQTSCHPPSRTAQLLCNLRTVPPCILSSLVTFA